LKEGGNIDMRKNNLASRLDRIRITPEAALILGRIYVSCPISESSISDFLALKTLSDLREIASLTMAELLSLAEERELEEIGVEEIVYVFAGPPHFKNLKLRASGEGLISTGQSYSQRLEELGMSVDNELVKAEFCLIDILTDAQVVDINDNQATLIKNIGPNKKIVIENCFIPVDIKVKPDDTVLTHYGIVVGVVGQDFSHEETEEILEGQGSQNQGHFRTMLNLLSISKSTIDCRKICSDKDHPGFDSTKWAKPRL
jgi:hypothetical protein